MLFEENKQYFRNEDCLPILCQLCLNEGGITHLETRIASLEIFALLIKDSTEGRSNTKRLRIFLDGQETNALNVIFNN